MFDAAANGLVGLPMRLSCLTEGRSATRPPPPDAKPIYSVRLDRVADGTAELAEVRVNNAYPDDGDSVAMLDLLFDKILPQYYGD